MTWFEALPTLLTALGVVFIPGLVIAGLGGARGLALWASAPGVSIGVIAALGTLYPFLGVSWSTVSAVVGILAIAVVAVLIGLLARRMRPRAVILRPARTWYIPVALLIAAVLIAAQLGYALGRPDNISQTFDASFHLNGVRYLLDHSTVSSFRLSGLTLPEGQSSFYPAAWHAVTASVAGLTGTSIPLAANSVNLVVATLAWPAGVVFLARTLWGSRSAILLAGVLAAAFPGFPLLTLDYGVVYPYFLALALVPTAVALGLALLRIGRPSTHWATTTSVLAVVLVAILLAQPSVAFAVGALILPAAVVAVWRAVRSATSPTWRVLLVAIALAAAVVFAIGWIVIGRVGTYAPWGPQAGPAGAVLQLITLRYLTWPAAPVVALLTLIGVVAILRTRHRWLAFSWAIAAILFLIAAAVPYASVRVLTIGLFYKDVPRLFALLSLASVPLAIYGARFLWGLIRVVVRGRRPDLRIGFAVAASAIVILLVATQVPSMAQAASIARTKYALTGTSPLLSIDERALLERLPETTVPGSVIVGNPWTGTPFGYALGGRQMLNPHFGLSGVPDVVTVNMHLTEATTDPEVCPAVDRLGVRYALDFGTYFRDAGDALDFDSTVNYRGLVDMADSDALTEVDREGDAVLYEITAC